MTFHVVNTRIGWVLRDKAPTAGEALVLPANDHLWMGAGPGLELKKKLGNEVELEAVRQGPAKLGEVVVTGGAGSGFTHLFHAVVSGQDLRWVEGAGADAVSAIVTEAEKRKLKEILVHPLHRGLHGDAMAASKEVLGAFLRELEEGIRLARVQIVVQDDGERQLFQDLFLQLLRGA